jgi:hypothetical protein
MGLEQLRDKDFVQMTILEHRDDELIVGVIDSGGMNPDGTLGLRWHHHYGEHLHRTTTFLPSCWRCEIVGPFISLFRTAKGPRNRALSDPPRNVDMYTLAHTDLLTSNGW